MYANLWREGGFTYGLPSGYSYELLNLLACVDQINQKKEKINQQLVLKKLKKNVSYLSIIMFHLRYTCSGSSLALFTLLIDY